MNVWAKNSDDGQTTASDAFSGSLKRACATGGGRPNNPLFKWVNTGLRNVKSAITGTCRSFDPQHADRYLAAFEWRFNRRFSLDENIERLARVAARTAPQPYNSIASIRPQAEMAG